jgi:hypothetical protein
MLEEGADFGARRRLARAQENRHRLAAVYVIDVDRQEAAGVVVGVEQRQLLVAVHWVAGIVDVDQRRRHPRRLKPRRCVLQPAHGGL